MKQGGVAPLLVLGVGVVAISWAAVLVRQAEAPALVIAAYRMTLAALPVGALAAWQHRRAPEPMPAATAGPILLSAVFLAAHFGFWMTSLQHTSVVVSVVLVAAQPLYVALASPLLLRERIERRIWFALLVAMAGVILMVAEDVGEGAGTVAGDAYAVLGGICTAGYVIAGRRVRPHVSWLRYVGTMYPATAVMLLIAALAAGDPLTGYSTRTLVMMGMLALGPQLVGHSAINYSLAYLSAVLVAMGYLLEPVGATALAALILDEWPSALEVAGSVLVLAGVYLAIRPRPDERTVIEVPAID